MKQYFPTERNLEGCSSYAKGQADMEVLFSQLWLKQIKVGMGKETALW